VGSEELGELALAVDIHVLVLAAGLHAVIQHTWGY
jgi:hypothetical protein